MAKFIFSWLLVGFLVGIKSLYNDYIVTRKIIVKDILDFFMFLLMGHIGFFIVVYGWLDAHSNKVIYRAKDES